MDLNSVLASLQEMDQKSKKRNFLEQIELIINLSGLDPKKPDGQVDLKIDLPYSTGRGEGKALLFARSDSFAATMKEDFETIIMEDKIPSLKKQDIQKILQHDVLLAEGPAMIAVGKYLGQELAPKGKMPKPVTTNPAEVRSELEKLKSSVRITNRRGKGIPIIQVVVGNDSMEREKIAKNILKICEEVEKVLPRKKQNIKSIIVKKTMGPAIKISGGK